MTIDTDRKWLERIREYGHLYEDMLTAGFPSAEAAKLVDRVMVADSLQCKLGRPPTFAEIDAKMQEL